MITIGQFISNYDGKVVGDGECGTLVRRYWIEVDGTNPPGYDDSKDYWFNPVPGYDKITSAPQDGDIAVYNGHGPTLPDGSLKYPEGHSAIYYDGVVFEQNADPDGSPAHLYPRANTYLLGYLRKQGQGVKGMTEKQAEDTLKYMYLLGTGVDPDSGQIDYWLPRVRDTETGASELGTALLKGQAPSAPTDFIPYSGEQLFTRKVK